MWTYLAIAIFGIFGCWARYGMTNLVQTIYGREFPYATLSINIGGSFLMGFSFIETLERLTIYPELRTGILTGFLGGYATFSTSRWKPSCSSSRAKPSRQSSMSHYQWCSGSRLRFLVPTSHEIYR